MDKIDLSNFTWNDPNEPNVDVSEIFALPFGLKPVAKFNSAILYSSQRLKESFIKALNKSGRTKSAINKFSKLTFDQRKIIPCFATKGITGFIEWKIFSPSNIKNIMGFYAPNIDKIIIIISNTANIFGHASNDFMAELTVHECIHMLSNKIGNGFVNLYRNELSTYYNILWSKIFQFDPKELSSDKIIPTVLFLNKLETSKSKITNSDLVKYHKMLHTSLKDITKLESNMFERMLNDYIVFIKIYLTSRNAFFQSARNFSHIISPMYATYKEAFNIKNLTTICIQELIYPSEIIAILSENKRYTSKALKGIIKL